MNERLEFEKACLLFDTEQYFEAHEVWEDLWNEASGPRHAFLQGLIQIAAALHHAVNGNYNGTRKLFASALGYLETGRSDSLPVDVDQLRDHVLEFELALQRGESELPFFKIPFLG